MNNQGFCKYNLEDFTEDDLVDLCKQHIPNNAKALDRVIDEMKLEDDDVWKPIVLKFVFGVLVFWCFFVVSFEDEELCPKTSQY
jgi:hypothetical protein